MRLDALGYALIIIHLSRSNVAAAIVNGTIDDQFGDSVTHQRVDYYPSQNVWDDQTCGSDKCDIVLDRSQVFDNTYTAGTYDPAKVGSIGINMQFTGTAIYVFFIIANFLHGPTLNSANFSVDGKPPVLFATTIPVTPTVIPHYDVLVFSLTNLSSALHTLNISTTGPTTSYVNFDYAIYTYDDGIATTSPPTAKTTSTTVTGAPARRTPVGAIVGGIAGGITLFALLISLLFCWHRRGGHDALQSDKVDGDPERIITQFMATVTVPGSESSNTDNRANMRNNHRTPPSEKALPSTSNLSVLGAGARTSNSRGASPPLQSPLDDPGTREEVRRARQEDLDNQLRVAQHNIVQLEESSARPGRSVSLRRQTSGQFGIFEDEVQLSLPDMQGVIRSLKEQIRVLKEQRQSAWAQGLSDDRPPGYTPMEVGVQISREASS
ncbi:uncharacterized protein LACBIDRAFT_328847 [Laccaria bicolor S238N-H82]|uniref:Predicted protein n=1 Tax=Laccaria bicolor (strain S238N-H82 / ATCC MYA-4686) TaxID=486041 RepID=B0DG65_LACBS|nr:uncharacterized protein LACBIDRAFT_328847 [Laccaria bicolor S238N-H82]EDR06589.1 predicted protein [Laccaria bicolor S238N-H82]|eukprot:XP_001882961.1 predicted protein [Laccaria bicolor S238N-H82]